MSIHILLVTFIIIALATSFVSGDRNNPPFPKGLLYPQESESREVRSLDGIWRFLKSDMFYKMEGVEKGWFLLDLDKVNATIPMPVPASYNDLTTLTELRDHVGTVWYERKFFVPGHWALDERKIWLRFGSVHYEATVWLNGLEVGMHSIGHLPFEADITSSVKYGAENRLTVLCDNSLSNTTIPQGEIVNTMTDSGIVKEQLYSFDFFNYAGIHRSVHLHTTPKIYIQDVEVLTDLMANGYGIVNYKITADLSQSNVVFYPPVEPLYVQTQLRNKDGELVCKNKTLVAHQGTLLVPNVKAWWPYLMHPEPGYLYTLELYLHSVDGALLDVYRLKVGIRSLQWTNSSLLFNGKPIYLRGFGRHEDSDLRGKGLDFALITRDFNLLKWIGANAYRTSHYPYSEESMQFADENGIMIIDECPSVNAEGFNEVLFENHKSALRQLIHRDRNHPSVIAWSIANEPRSAESSADEYFKNLTAYTKTLDRTRPITASINVDIEKDHLAQYLDIISFNRYNAWYQNSGELDTITDSVIQEATAWHELYERPILMSEYGADTMEGLHTLPTYIWSEEFQTNLLSKHFKAFDALRKEKWFIGEFVWNFADFKTEQTYTRVGGNKKGIFTRNRQPKTAAFLLRQRYHGLAHILEGFKMPKDLFEYVVNWPDMSTRDKSEL